MVFKYSPVYYQETTRKIRKQQIQEQTKTKDNKNTLQGDPDIGITKHRQHFKKSILDFSHVKLLKTNDKKILVKTVRRKIGQSFLEVVR